jgi:hypothetical protein
MPRRAKHVDLRAALLSGIPEHAKDLFAILEMRSLTPEYFQRFAPSIQGIGFGEDDSWMFALLHDTASPASSAVADPGVLVPVVLMVSDRGAAVLHETSTEVLWRTSWDRTCRVDLRAFESGEYQIFALSYFIGLTSVSERFSDASTPPLRPAEIGVLYFYAHATPSDFEGIDRHWAAEHISQERHQLPDLLM